MSRGETIPRPVRQFRHFYLGSIGLAVITLVSNIALGRNPANVFAPYIVQDPPMAAAVVVATTLTVLLWSILMPLGLAWLAGWKASRIAKWLIVLLAPFGILRLISLVGVLIFLMMRPEPWPGGTGWLLTLGFATEGLHMAAIPMLFRRDARAFFRGAWQAPPHPAEIFG